MSVDPSPEPGGSVHKSVAPKTAARRVLLVECNEDSTVGGSHQALRDLVVNLDPARYEPVVLFYQDNRHAEWLASQGVEVHSFERERAIERHAYETKGRVARSIELVRSIGRRSDFIRDQRIDLVHLNNSPFVGNDDWLPAARLTGRPIVASVRGDATLHRRWVHQWLARRFDRVFPVSEYISQAIRQKGYPPERITLVHDGGDLEALRAQVRRDPGSVRSELGLRDGELLLLMVGNIRQWKGQHVVLEALALLPDGVRERVRVVFAGGVIPGDSYPDELQAFIDGSAGLRERVLFLGARSDVPDLFAAADLAIHASVKPEPFGLVVVEAMALGAPVIVSGAGGPAEVVTPESGRSYPAGDGAALAECIRELVEDPGLRSRLVDGARRRVEEFSIDHVVRKIQAQYDEVLK